MDLKQLSRYYHTVKHLKTKQILYSIYYRLRDELWPVHFDNSQKAPQSTALLFTEYPNTGNSYAPVNNFEFLNLSHPFDDQIDWNSNEYGKLWTYNLNYFDFLHQPEMEKETGLRLIRDFIKKQHGIKDGMEPYPISLRGINWIKFLSLHEIHDSDIDRSLYNQYRLLIRSLEYHLMGNHLLENGMSLLFGGVYFDDSVFLEKAKSILFEQLKEQVLQDGAHFERSPMYHLILLNRLLDCFNLLSQNDYNEELLGLESFLEKKITLMIGWLRYARFSSNDLPALNDSTNTLPFDPQKVLDYGRRLELKNELEMRDNQGVGESGYLMVRKPGYELFIDAGKPGPDYIPGHAHCDIFSFVLYINNKPVIVDPGISTYEEGRVRNYERSTVAHNTVAVDGTEQSDIWKAFRVGRRAEVTLHDEDKRTLIASHNGFWDYGLIHERGFSWGADNIQIEDRIKGGKDQIVTALFHFHPHRKIALSQNRVLVDDTVDITFQNAIEIMTGDYHYSHDFNQRERAECIKVKFKEKLTTNITFNEKAQPIS